MLESTVLNSGNGALKASLIDVSSTDQEVNSFLDNTIHTFHRGSIEATEDNTVIKDEETSGCFPGICACHPSWELAVQLAWSFHTHQQQRRIQTGALFMMTCKDIPAFSRTFFTAVTSKKPLIQTVVLASVADSNVSCHERDEVPVVTTTTHMFLELLDSSNGKVSEVDVEHWFCQPFVDDNGVLHVNAEHVLDSFSFSRKRPTTLKPPPVPLPFGLTLRKKWKPRKPKAKAKAKGVGSKEDDKKRKVEVDSDAHQSENSSESVSSSDQVDNSGNNDNVDADNDIDDTEPLNSVMRSELEEAREVAREIENADHDLHSHLQGEGASAMPRTKATAVTASLSEEKKGSTIAPTSSKGRSFFSTRLGLGSGSVAPTGRAKCYHCRELISQGSVRFEWWWNKLRPNGWVHSFCVPSLSEKSQLCTDTVQQLENVTATSASSQAGDPVLVEASRLLRAMRS